MKMTEYDEIKVNLIKKSLEKDKTDVYVPIERRKGSDGRLKFINIMCFLVWAVLLIITALVEKAGKSIAHITANNLWQLPVEFWRVDLLNAALYITIGCIFICTLCIILNFTRHKRRTDRIKKSLVICEMICFAITVFLILKLY